MKKQTKIILGALVVVVIAIVAISLGFPPVQKGESSGTFGKADKYHKSQLTEKDVQLRSKLTADTAQLKQMIQGLAYFAVFTNDVSNKIDSCFVMFQEKGLNSQDLGYSDMMALKDYSAFIRNNNKILVNTTNLLSGFYYPETADQSVDVEQSMREFGNYVKNLNQKDKVIEPALKSMDRFISTNKILQERKEEMRKLKGIRDQLLIKGVQLGGMVGDKSLISGLSSLALQAQLGSIGSQENNLGIIKAQGNLQVNLMNSKEALGQVSFINSQVLGYNSTIQSFEIKAVNAAADLNGISIIAGFGGMGVVVICANYNMNSATVQQAFGNALNVNLMNANGPLGVGFTASTNLAGMALSFSGLCSTLL